jgi:hypothetical protein
MLNLKLNNMEYHYTLFSKITHTSEELANDYVANPLKYHEIQDGKVSKVVKFMNSYGFWQTSAEIQYNVK